MENAQIIILLKVYLKEIAANRNNPEHPAERIARCALNAKNVILKWDFDPGDEESRRVQYQSVGLIENAMLLMENFNHNIPSGILWEEATSIAESAIHYFLNFVKRMK